LLSLFVTQARLAASTSRFPQRGLAVGAIVVHPTSHRLRDNAELSSNLGLTQSTLQHLNRLKASFL
jgi:hypothetical protein